MALIRADRYGLGWFYMFIDQATIKVEEEQ
jgi:hypothetical protein